MPNDKDKRIEDEIAGLRYKAKYSDIARDALWVIEQQQAEIEAIRLSRDFEIEESNKAKHLLQQSRVENERLREELEQVKAERDKYQKALHEEQRESVRLSEILDRIGNICIEHENAKYQPIGTVRMIQKLAAYAEDHTPTEREEIASEQGD
jgi:predicted P-loop ATPase/GTPase